MEKAVSELWAEHLNLEAFATIVRWSGVKCFKCDWWFCY